MINILFIFLLFVSIPFTDNKESIKDKKGFIVNDTSEINEYIDIYRRAF